MQTYIVKVSGSILNISTVHLNGIWHLIWHYLSKPVLGGHPVLSEHYSIPQGCSLNTGFTVSSKKFTLAQSKRFPPKHNPPVRGNNSWEQAAFWHEVKVVHWIIPINRVLFVVVVVFNLIFALFLFLFISHYFKKTVHGPGPWQGVHGPGPWKWSMDPVQGGGLWTPGPCFVLTQLILLSLIPNNIIY